MNPAQPSRIAKFGLPGLLTVLIVVAWNPGAACAVDLSLDLPAWLQSKIGEGEGQIARPVLERARDLYRRKLQAGLVRNPCYFAMDATRPNGDDSSAGRFYVICEAEQTMRVVSAGHGGGRNLPGAAYFLNDRVCAKHFGNAQDSNLTAGGAYLTGTPTTSFKGYYPIAGSSDAPLLRTFLPFDGEDETDNARARAIGGHAAETLKGVCLKKAPASPYANPDGYVLEGLRVDYTGGRSDGCTSWSPSDAAWILKLVASSPTTLYLYPASADIDAVSRDLAAGRSPSVDGLYWNTTCLAQIGAPRFWPRAELEPILSQYQREHPSPPAKPTPICTAQGGRP